MRSWAAYPRSVTVSVLAANCEYPSRVHPEEFLPLLISPSRSRVSWTFSPSSQCPVSRPILSRVANALHVSSYEDIVIAHLHRSQSRDACPICQLGRAGHIRQSSLSPHPASRCVLATIVAPQPTMHTHSVFRHLSQDRGRAIPKEPAHTHTTCESASTILNSVPRRHIMRSVRQLHSVAVIAHHHLYGHASGSNCCQLHHRLFSSRSHGRNDPARVQDAGEPAQEPQLRSAQNSRFSSRAHSRAAGSRTCHELVMSNEIAHPVFRNLESAQF